METKTRLKSHAALFPDNASADAAYKAALDRGYTKDEINVIMTDKTKQKYFSSTAIKTEMGDKSMEGLAIGGALGGTVVGVLGAIVALSTTIVIPGLGLVIAGPLAAGLVGAGTGSIAGGLLGALIGAGIPEEHATIYENGIRRGDILISFKSHSDEADAELLKNWKTFKGKDIY